MRSEPLECFNRNYQYLNDYEDYCTTNIGVKAIRFDQENPHIYVMFKELANEAKRAGYGKYSANGIFEVMRWKRSIESNDKFFKMNNNYRAYYARKLMAEVKAFEGFFEVRKGE